MKSTTFAGLLRRFASNESGMTMLEYGLILAFVSVAIINASMNLGGGPKAQLEAVDEFIK